MFFFFDNLLLLSIICSPKVNLSSTVFGGFPTATPGANQNFLQ